jgi:tetratricopeptide (TPR) repeat protein
VKLRAPVFGLAVALAVVTLGGVAWARNPHCAGGIQYVAQGLRDKVKDPESWNRQMHKAVDQLTTCSTEDPADYEAIGYLGWAYAELDSATQAGDAFEKAIAGLISKGDKKASLVSDNRDHYFGLAFNDGIAKINAAQALYPDFSKEAASDDDKKAKAAATAKYEEARVSLERASKYKPTDTASIRNLGSIDAFMGNFVSAEATFRRGLVMAPGDSALNTWIKLVRTNYARRLTDEKKFDEALAFYNELAKSDAGNADLHMGIASAYFERAKSKEGDARKPDYRAAGEEYSKASDLKKGDVDLLFNAGLAYQNAGDWALADKQWKAVLQIKPDDTDAMSADAACLAELAKYDDAVHVLIRALELKPDEKSLHRQLGGVYAKAGNNAKSYEHMVVYLAFAKGEAKDKLTPPAGSVEAATIAKEGAPEAIRVWDADGEKYDTLAYWKKKVVYTFKNGQLAVKTDWSSPAKVGTAAGGTKK